MSDVWAGEVLDNGSGVRGNEIIPGIRGLPDSPTPVDVSVIFGPRRWLRWRREVRRLGPYAAAYDGRVVRLQTNDLRIGFVALVLAVFTVVVVMA